MQAEGQPRNSETCPDLPGQLVQNRMSGGCGLTKPAGRLNMKAASSSQNTSQMLQAHRCPQANYSGRFPQTTVDPISGRWGGVVRLRFRTFPSQRCLDAGYWTLVLLTMLMPLSAQQCYITACIAPPERPVHSGMNVMPWSFLRPSYQSNTSAISWQANGWH